MSSQCVPPKPSIPDAQPLPDYIEDGARIAAILLVWGVIAAAVGWLTTDVIPVDNILLGPGLGGVFALAGLLNALLYAGYRVVDYWTAL